MNNNIKEALIYLNEYLNEKLNDALVRDDVDVALEAIFATRDALATLTQDDHQAPQKLSCHLRSIATRNCVVAKAYIGTRRCFYSNSDWVCGEGFSGAVYEELKEGDRMVCSVHFNRDIKSHNAVNRIMNGALRGVCSYYGKRFRNKSNARAKASSSESN